MQDFLAFRELIVAIEVLRALGDHVNADYCN